MSSHSREIIRDLVSGQFPWPQTRRIMSAYKDEDRFLKYLAVLQECVAWEDRILLPIGDRHFITDGQGGRVTRCLLPGMIAHGWSRVINIGSTAATVGWRDNPAYCASKAGLLGLTRCVALEGAPHGVTCVMISPTWVETELMRRNLQQLVAREGRGRSLAEAMEEVAAQNPQRRLIQPGEIAALAAFLCRDEARGITMENIRITGGALW